MLIVGIDPGQKGGIAHYYQGTYGAIEMPSTTRQILRHLDELTTCYGPMIAVIEEPQLMGNKLSGKTLMSFGKHYGEIIGCLTAVNASIIETRPAVWKRGLNLSKDKNESILLCERLYPDIELFPGRCTKGKDGLAEAMLLVHWYRTKN